MEKMQKKVLTTLYEGNQGAIAMAINDKATHQIKHISTKFHHVCQYVKDKMIVIEYIPTTSQLADIFTKLVTPVLFQNLRKKLMGW